MPDTLVRWRVDGATVATRVDTTRIAADSRPRLLLPNGDRAPAWMVLDPRTGMVTGTRPDRGDARTSLRAMKVADRSGGEQRESSPHQTDSIATFRPSSDPIPAPSR